MKRYLPIAIIILSILAGCTHRPLPVATSYPVTAQRKMQAAHHWNVLAEDLAKRLKKTLDITFPNAVVKPALAISSTQAQEKTPFGKAFHRLLTAKLVQQGLVVLTDLSFGDNMVIEYDMQVIHHKDRRLTYLPPGLLTALASGVWMADQAQSRWRYPGLAAIPFALLGDMDSFLNYFLPGETNTEVVITTSVKMGQQYVFGDARIYYINDDDYDHYENQQKTYQLVDQR
jgi:hypothetical protein